MNLLRLFGCGSAASANRPYRFVCDDNAGGVFGACVLQACLQLPEHDPKRLAMVALFERFTDAQDRRHAIGERRRDPPGNQFVGLFENVAPFSSKCIFCAPSMIDEPASACATAGMARNGGATITSRSRASVAASRSSSPRSAVTNARPSTGVMFIFQLPANSFLRIGLSDIAALGAL